MGSVKKPQTSAKAEGKTAAQRHQASTGKKKGGPKTWNHSHHPPHQQERAKNGRHEGRNLITWTRKSNTLSHFCCWFDGWLGLP